ncbi:MAG: LON peptidase substrate-binding domain-containing protein [Chlorobi bacterium]|nr:LON peptidase substrate-binding domain-containing protein [Chlorobiota bacterium]
MSIVTEHIGLFPLGTVLFPGAYLPLHIFEHRYRRLVAECIETDQPFGINLFDEGDLHLIGCTARVRGILRHYDDGRLDIVVVGQRRYLLQAIEDASKPYIVGTIEYYDDRPDSTINPELYRRCAELYNTVVERVFPDHERFQLPLDTIPSIEGSTPSFFMAQKAGLKLIQKQQLLSLQSENERLDYLIGHLAELLPRLNTIGETLRVARLDGYFARLS